LVQALGRSASSGAEYVPAGASAPTMIQEIGFALHSPLEEVGFELVWGFSCQVVVFGFSQFFVRSGKAVLHPVACDQVRGARGRGQGTETVAQLGGLPPSVACVSQEFLTRKHD
jgi:hypothetical protein